MLLLLNAVRQVKFSTAMALLQSENYGEKPPKANWILGVGGFVLLAAAYYLAVSITTPLDANDMVFRGSAHGYRRDLHDFHFGHGTDLQNSAEQQEVLL